MRLCLSRIIEEYLEKNGIPPSVLLRSIKDESVLGSSLATILKNIQDETGLSRERQVRTDGFFLLADSEPNLVIPLLEYWIEMGISRSL